MPPGTVLRIWQHLRRIGIMAKVGTEYGAFVVRTPDVTACYDEAEIVQLAAQAPHWQPGQFAEDILW